MDQERLFQVGPEVAWDLGLLNALLGLATLDEAASFGQVDLAVDGEEARLFELDAEAIV